MGKALDISKVMLHVLGTACELRVLVKRSNNGAFLEERAWEIALRLEELARDHPCPQLCAASLILRANTQSPETLGYAFEIAADLLEHQGLAQQGTFRKLEMVRRAAH